MERKPTTPPGERLKRPIGVRASDMPPGRRVRTHSHAWGQLLYAAEGIMAVYTEQGNWLVPPERAVWIPINTDHGVFTPHGAKFRSVYVDTDHCGALPQNCCVLAVSPLLRELLLHAATLPEAYNEDGPDGRLVQVILDCIRAAEPVPLHLPLPRDARLRRITDSLLQDPANPRTLADFAADAGGSTRTLSRLFEKELGLTFRQWRQQCRLQAALQRLAEGTPVTTVALDLGYDSPSAFIAMFRKALGTTPAAYFAETGSG